MTKNGIIIKQILHEIHIVIEKIFSVMGPQKYWILLDDDEWISVAILTWLCKNRIDTDCILYNAVSEYNIQKEIASLNIYVHTCDIMLRL